MNVCVYVSYTIYVSVYVCEYVRAHVYVCVCVSEYMCVHTTYSHCESYNICNIIFYIMKYKMYFEMILISLDEAKFNNDIERFEFGAPAARYIGYEIIQ